MTNLPTDLPTDQPANRQTVGSSKGSYTSNESIKSIFYILIRVDYTQSPTAYKNINLKVIGL